MLKDALCSAPILKYPDTSKPYTIFTDASKYGWAGVLTQEHTSVIDGKEVTKNHLVSFVSGLFYGSQLNWAAMTKEVYAIYMTVKKNTFYLTGQDITLRSDHLPLKKLDIDPDISVGEKLATVDDVDICEINITYDNPENSEFSVQLPLSNEKFVCLQEKDAKFTNCRRKSRMDYILTFMSSGMTYFTGP